MWPLCQLHRSDLCVKIYACGLASDQSRMAKTKHGLVWFASPCCGTFLSQPALLCSGTNRLAFLYYSLPSCVLSCFLQILRSIQQWATMTSTPKISFQLRRTRSTMQQQNYGAPGLKSPPYRSSEQVCDGRLCCSIFNWPWETVLKCSWHPPPTHTHKCFPLNLYKGL